MDRVAHSLHTGLLLGAMMMSHAVAAEPAPLTGEWGGFQTALTLDETGGQVRFDCAAATIDQPVRPDAEGRFVVPGRYEAHTPGPDRDADQPARLAAARFEGRVEGRTLHLTMHLPGAGTHQDFELVQGRKVKIIRCL